MPRFHLTPFADITWNPTGEYLVKGVLPVVGLVLVYGAPKCGKSFWASDLAMHIARGIEYRGKRVRLSGYLKTIGVNEGTAVLFMRVDGDGLVLMSDYMQNRPLMLTNDWARQEIVLDVPRNAIGVTYGFLLGGSGQTWLDDVAIDVVGDDVAATGQRGGLYPVPPLSDREIDRRRRDQEIAYRRAAAAPVNLALRSTGGAVIVAARNNSP